MDRYLDGWKNEKKERRKEGNEGKKEQRKEGMKERRGWVREGSSLPESSAPLSGRSEGMAARLRSTYVRAPTEAWTLLSDRLGVKLCSAAACG